MNPTRGMARSTALAKGRWFRITVVLCIALGTFLRFYHLGTKVFWEDEILGAVHMLGYTEGEIVAASPRLTDAGAVQRYLRAPARDEHRPLSATVRSLALEDPQHPPGYYLAGRLWAQTFGSSPAVIRVLPAIFGVLVLPLVYLLALTLFASSETALVAVAMVALSPFYVLYAQEAREYSLWTVAVLAAGVLLLRASRAPELRPWLAYALCVAAALYIYPLTALVAAGFGVYLFVREGYRLTRTVVAFVLATALAVAAFAPWLFAMRSAAGLARGMAGIVGQHLSPATIALTFARDVRFIFFDFGLFRIGPVSSTAINLLFTAFAVALCGYALVALVRSRPFAVWGFVVIGLCGSMVPLLLMDLFVHGRFVYQARYFIPLLLGLQLAVAALLAGSMFDSGRPRLRTLARTGFAVVLAGGLLSCVASARADTWWNKDYERSRAVAAIVNAAPKPLVVADYTSPSILALSLYLDPAVPLRVRMQCTQCSTTDEPPAPELPRSRTDSTVFVLQRSAVGSDAQQRWINPATFPARADQLDLFTAL